MLPVSERLAPEQSVLETPARPMVVTVEVQQRVCGDHRPLGVPGLAQVLGPERVAHLPPCPELDHVHVGSDHGGRLGS